MRRFALLLSTALVLLLGVFMAWVWSGVHRRPANAPVADVRFRVNGGESFTSVTARLHDERLVKETVVFKWYARVTGDDRKIRPGTYSISTAATPAVILDKFVAGDVFKVSVTIPEGWMYAEIVDALAETAAVDSTELSGLFGDPAFMRTLGVGETNLEGYLYPDTYFVPYEADAKDVVRMMVSRMNEVFTEELLARADAVGMSRHDVLTLASIVEAETGVPYERPQVAAVYTNRLRRGMKLEADPTVAYAKGGYRGRLFYRDLEIDSPYNTYIHQGLPPGPICSPGDKAIHASLFPDSTCQALYFVASGDGGHVFSMTLREHLVAVKQLRAIRAQQRNR